MSVDVISEVIIARPPAEVSAFTANPDNAPAWYVNIKAVEWKSQPPFRVGSKIAFVAQFLGKRLAYTYELVELIAGERLVMRTAEGPFPMESTYSWEPTQQGGTRMRLRKSWLAVRLFSLRGAIYGDGNAQSQSQRLGESQRAAGADCKGIAASSP